MELLAKVDLNNLEMRSKAAVILDQLTRVEDTPGYENLLSQSIPSITEEQITSGMIALKFVTMMIISTYCYM